MNYLIKGFNVLPQPYKNQTWFVIIVQFIKFFFEILGLGLIIPVIYILSKGQQAFIDLSREYKILQIFGEDIYASNYFVIYLLISIVAIFLVRFLFLLFAAYVEEKWLQKATAKSAHELFKYYLGFINDLSERKNYEILTLMTQELAVYYKFFVKSVLTIFTEALKFIGILAILFFVNPFVLIFGILVASIISLIILKLIKKRVEIYGKKRLSNSELLTRYISEGLNSVKEIKLSSNSNYFTEKLKNYANDNANIQVKFYILSILPRQSIEFVTIILIVILIYYLMLTNPNDYNSSLFVIGAYVAGLSRLLPSLNSIYLCVQNIMYSTASVEKMSRSIHDMNKNIEKVDESFKYKFTENYLNPSNIYIKKINFSYNKNIKIFDNLDLFLEKGKIYCLTGDSGSGKSTFINILMGFIKPDTGSIEYDNINIFKNLPQWQKSISYLPQKVFLLNDSIKKNVAFSLEEKDIDVNKVIRSLEEVNLMNLFKADMRSIDSEVGDDGIKLSGGQRQRIGIARNLYFNKKILILDEFTSSLDSVNESKVFEEISKIKKDKIIIMITHSKRIMEMSDEILLIKNKTIKISN